MPEEEAGLEFSTRCVLHLDQASAAAPVPVICEPHIHAIFFDSTRRRLPARAERGVSEVGKHVRFWVQLSPEHFHTGGPAVYLYSGAKTIATDEDASRWNLLEPPAGWGRTAVCDTTLLDWEPGGEEWEPATVADGMKGCWRFEASEIGWQHLEVENESREISLALHHHCLELEQEPHQILGPLRFLSPTAVPEPSPNDGWVLMVPEDLPTQPAARSDVLMRCMLRFLCEKMGEDCILEGAFYPLNRKPLRSNGLVYQFGTQRIHVNDQSQHGVALSEVAFIVHTGGGFLDFFAFVRKFGPLEARKLRRVAAQQAAQYRSCGHQPQLVLVAGGEAGTHLVQRR